MPTTIHGQTGSTFKTLYRERIQVIGTHKRTSKYALHLLDTGHAYNTIEETIFSVTHKKEGSITKQT
jgi:hypothetical protein